MCGKPTGIGMSDDKFLTFEPIFHCFDDCFDDDHKLAYEVLWCVDCREMVHCSNNETMKAWFETGLGPMCLECFYALYQAEPTYPRPDRWDQLQFNEGRHV